MQTAAEPIVVACRLTERTRRRCNMAGEIRHCERCDHEFEVEVTPAAGGNKVEGCPDTAAADCGLPKQGERVKILREID